MVRFLEAGKGNATSSKRSAAPRVRAATGTARQTPLSFFLLLLFFFFFLEELSFYMLVTPIFLYACESWTLTAELQRRIQAMEMYVLPQDTTHLIQRPRYQRGSSCQDPAGNRTTRRPPDDRKETQTAVVWSCLPFITSGQNHLARDSERGKKTR